MKNDDEANPVFWLAARAGKMGQSCSLEISRIVPAKAKFFGVIFWLYHKSFIDQACSVKMAGYWPRSCFAFFMDRDEVQVHKNAKWELGHTWWVSLVSGGLGLNELQLEKTGYKRVCF